MTIVLKSQNQVLLKPIDAVFVRSPAGPFVGLLLLAIAASAQADETLPTPVRLEQAAARSRAKLKLPRGRAVGPTIPGLRQGAVPQGLAYWKKQNWLLISCY